MSPTAMLRNRRARHAESPVLAARSGEVGPCKGRITDDVTDRPHAAHFDLTEPPSGDLHEGLKVSERVTLRRVAEEAGVHTSTASRALNPATRGVVNAATVSKVMEVAENLGYRPHPMARGLRTNKTMTVGMVVPDVENPLFGAIIAGLEQEIGQEGYSLLIANTDPRLEDSLPLIDALVRGRVDGLVLATAPRSGASLAPVTGFGVPVVLVNRKSEDLAIPSITGDDDVGIGLAVQHLVDLGHERIGHVAGPASLSTGADRRAGFERWTKQLGVKIAPVEEADWYRMEQGRVACARLLQRAPDLTAIVAANDLLALGVYRAITDSGRQVGVDISVTGYNDIAFMEFVQPPMTSVRVQYREMGAEAAVALLRLMAGWDEPVESVSLPPSLSVRASTAPPSG